MGRGGLTEEATLSSRRRETSELWKSGKRRAGRRNGSARRVRRMRPFRPFSKGLAFTLSRSVRFGVESDTRCLPLRAIVLASALRAAARGARQGVSGSGREAPALAQAKAVAG